MILLTIRHIVGMMAEIVIVFGMDLMEVIVVIQSAPILLGLQMASVIWTIIILNVIGMVTIVAAQSQNMMPIVAWELRKFYMYFLIIMNAQPKDYWMSIVLVLLMT